MPDSNIRVTPNGVPYLEPPAETLSCSRPAWVAVDLDALTRNLAWLRSRLGPARILAVVKADAYGHGAVVVAKALEEASVDGLAVALVEEGAELRRGGIRAPILVLGPAQEGQLSVVHDLGLTPTLSSLAQVASWCQWQGAAGEVQGVHLEVDTGMSRLGISPSDLPHALSQLRQRPQLRLQGLCSHLASADDLDCDQSEIQERRFLEVVRELTDVEREQVLIHLANSAGALHWESSRHDLVRVGLALYGLDAAGVEGEELEPVMSVRARIVELRRVEEGAAVGYGGTWIAPQSTQVAVVPVGYGDGYAWRLAPGAEALVAGQRVPLVGALSMDVLTLDVTGVGARAGDDVVLLGQQAKEEISAWELAQRAGTIPYEILCSFGLRLPRYYFRHGQAEGSTSRFS